MPFFNPSEREPLQPFGTDGPSLRTFWGENIMVSLVEMAPGSAAPLHSHPQEQAGYVLEGELEFAMEGKKTKVGPGGVFFIPGGVEHAVTVTSPCAAMAVDIFSPIRDDYIY